MTDLPYPPKPNYVEGEMPYRYGQYGAPTKVMAPDGTLSIVYVELHRPLCTVGRNVYKSMTAEQFYVVHPDDPQCLLEYEPTP